MPTFMTKGERRRLEKKVDQLCAGNSLQVVWEGQDASAQYAIQLFSRKGYKVVSQSNMGIFNMQARLIFERG